MKSPRAVIDIGTNSVKLLVADLTAQGVVPLLERSEQTRLGRGLYEMRRLQNQAIEETAQAVADYVQQAQQMFGARPRLIATSAAREAVNVGDLEKAVHARSGFTMEIISGEQEAEYVFRGVCTDPRLHDRRMLILDVGGGSTEFIIGEHGHHSFRQSFPLGSVRLMEQLRPDDPPSLQDLSKCRSWLTEFFAHEIAPAVESFLRPGANGGTALVGTGGTATILARIAGQQAQFVREEIEHRPLLQSEVLGMMVDLWSVALEQRRQIVGLPAKRADIILMGVAIFEAVMQHFAADELFVSTRGLRFGAILDEG